MILFLSAYCGYGSWGPCGQTEPGLLDFLAVTGSDSDLMTGGIITAVLFMLGGGILFAYNHLRNKE